MQRSPDGDHLLASQEPFVSMAVLGLTGSFGSGKSTVAEFFERRGACVIDADKIARSVVAPGQPALAKLAQLLGAQALDQDGSLNRPYVRERIFADGALRRQVEAIIHPEVRREELRLLDVYQDRDLVVLMAPLLLENKMQNLVDAVLVVVCEENLMKERAKLSSALTSDEVDACLAAQLPQAEKRRRADFVIDNSGTLPETERQVQEVYRKFMAAQA